MAGLGGGGGNIPGHSGTQFKHRKAFSGAKAFYKTWRTYIKPSVAGSSQSYEETKRARQQQKAVEIRILVYLMLFLGVLTVGCLWYFDQNFPA